MPGLVWILKMQKVKGHKKKLWMGSCHILFLNILASDFLIGPQKWTKKMEICLWLFILDESRAVP